MRRGTGKWEAALCLPLDEELRRPALYGLSAISNTEHRDRRYPVTDTPGNPSREGGTAHWKPGSSPL